ncbi:hypothetical protein L905_21750 [Agrobacterium sp. TS43]|nr:hypothetical protein L902_10420 [Agrobacterium radiobacter DSM 30147]KDR87246.1 hypothetical protein K538_28670 [Agrobacterium tumefaciens GW4]KVK45112.1 hypothetical protein L904_26475 [Agrobacterium sp. LY4]KVK45142.1 hypothetical protein L903_26345 [Agrobacterium sp. JL28]KVK58498.1 hypothetical protein L906_26260 [Agrobacterium sp. TS45]KVK61330.1 hypothetical protein L905_21750 [Agrobacterium sp. TS43]KVK61853.1 hypothetical protein L907_26195 [Agrobacterium sp. C13]
MASGGSAPCFNDGELFVGMVTYFSQNRAVDRPYWERRSVEFKGSFQIDQDAIRRLQEIADSEWPKVLERIKLQSLASGMEVKYDLSNCGMEWSPVFWHEVDHPIAWMHNTTGERRKGATYPDEPA